jgi:HEAT repeat protein
LQDNDNGVRLSCARTLLQLETECVSTIPVLIEALQDSTPFENTTSRNLAAELLGKIGPPARKAEPVLRVALLNDDYDFAEISRVALSRIGGLDITSTNSDGLSSPR